MEAKQRLFGHFREVTNSGISENEKAWITFLRMISDGRDLAPTLERVQFLRRALSISSVA